MNFTTTDVLGNISALLSGIQNPSTSTSLAAPITAAISLLTMGLQLFQNYKQGHFHSPVTFIHHHHHETTVKSVEVVEKKEETVPTHKE